MSVRVSVTKIYEKQKSYEIQNCNFRWIQKHRPRNATARFWTPRNISENITYVINITYKYYLCSFFYNFLETPQTVTDILRLKNLIFVTIFLSFQRVQMVLKKCILHSVLAAMLLFYLWKQFVIEILMGANHHSVNKLAR